MNDRRADSAGAGTGRPDGGKASGRRVRVLPIGVALILTAAIGFLLVHLAGGGSDPSHAPGADNTGTNATSPVSSTDSAAPSPGPTIPAAWAGPWHGQVGLAVAGTALDVKINLTAGSAGPDTIAYSSGSQPVCSGELTPQSTAPDGTLTLSQGIIVGQKKCGNGTVNLASSGSGLSFTFRGKGAPPTTGILIKG